MLPEASRTLAALTLDTEYRTGSGDLVSDFYIPCLRNAVKYDRAAGYFRSSVLLIIQQALVDFARSGGIMRLVCSPDLRSEDIAALSQGYADRESVLARSLARDVDDLLSDVVTRDRTVALATLVATGALSVRIAHRLPSQGIFHEKLGLFHDSFGHTVSFKGSINESWSGWHDSGNIESFEVFCTWSNELDAQRIARHRRHFEELWSDQTLGVRTTPFPDAAMRNLLSVARETLGDIELGDHPVGMRRTLLDHQRDALESWRGHGCRGILEHATGSGKTFTAIKAIEERLAVGDVAILLVPSRLLLDQWFLELAQELPGAIILRAGAGHDSWKRRGRLEGMTIPGSDLGQRIVLATMATAHTGDFLSRISDGSHLFLVADEAHRLGSPEYSAIFALDTGPRLGLSATPRRYGDPDGTGRLFDYFERVVPPPFTLSDAIAARRLVPYEYYPHLVSLVEDEASEWNKLTTLITRESAKALRKDYTPSAAELDRIKHLLIRRARLAKQASQKTPLALKLARDHYQSPDRWLVYCDDSQQLSAVLAALREGGFSPLEYHSQMAGARQETLAWFTRNGGILVSINCLDEGVDIPIVSHAVILASSQNPRQFIQRRGRVLRPAPGKTIATIHDAIVTPPRVAASQTDAMDGLFRNELRRALEFATGAINRSSEASLLKLAIDLNIALSPLEDAGIEEDNDGD